MNLHGSYYMLLTPNIFVYFIIIFSLLWTLFDSLFLSINSDMHNQQQRSLHHWWCSDKFKIHRDNRKASYTDEPNETITIFISLCWMIETQTVRRGPLPTPKVCTKKYGKKNNKLFNGWKIWFFVVICICMSCVLNCECVILLQM